MEAARDFNVPEAPGRGDKGNTNTLQTDGQEDRETADASTGITRETHTDGKQFRVPVQQTRHQPKAISTSARTQDGRARTAPKLGPAPKPPHGARRGNEEIFLNNLPRGKEAQRTEVSVPLKQEKPFHNELLNFGEHPAHLCPAVRALPAASSLPAATAERVAVLNQASGGAEETGIFSPARTEE